MAQNSMQNRKPLNREAYLKRIVTKPVELADGAVLNIRALPASVVIDGAKDASHFEAANLLIQSLVDEDGQRLFVDGEKEQVLVLDNTSLRIVLDAIMSLNGLKSVEAGEVGEVEKN